MSKWLVGALSIAVLVIGGAVGVGVWQGLRMAQTITDATVINMNKIGAAADAIKPVLDQSTKTLAAAQQSLALLPDTLGRINSVLDHVNALCKPVKGVVYTVEDDKPCGTLADIARTLHTIRGTFGTIEVAGIHMDKSLTTYDKQEADLSTNTNAVLKNVSDTIDYAHQLMAAHVVFLDNLQRLAGNSADTMSEVHGVVKDIHVQTTKMNQPKTKQQQILEWMPVVVKGAISTACMVTGAC